jgi:hypothetical protein
MLCTGKMKITYLDHKMTHVKTQVLEVSDAVYRKNANFIFIRACTSLTQAKNKSPLSFGSLVPEKCKMYIWKIR